MQFLCLKTFTVYKRYKDRKEYSKSTPGIKSSAKQSLFHNIGNGCFPLEQRCVLQTTRFNHIKGIQQILLRPNNASVFDSDDYNTNKTSALLVVLYSKVYA